MKFFLPILATLILAGTPCLAGIAIIPGTGTNGELGRNDAGSGSATLAVTTTASVASGSLIIVAASLRGADTINSCTDSASNTYAAGRSTNQNGESIRIFYSYTTSTLGNGGTVTCTWNSTSGGKSMLVAAFSGSASSPYDVGADTGLTSTGLIAVGPTPTLTCPGGGANCELVIAAITINDANAPTADGSFVTFAFQDQTSFMSMAYKIVSATTAITWAPTLNGPSQFWAAQIEGFKAAVAAGGAHNLTLMGVGK